MEERSRGIHHSGAYYVGLSDAPQTTRAENPFEGDEKDEYELGFRTGEALRRDKRETEP